MCLMSATCRLSDLRKPPSAAEPPPSATEPSAAADRRGAAAVSRGVAVVSHGAVSRRRQPRSRRHQPRSLCRQPRSRRRSVSCDLAKLNKRKLQTFDRPLGLPGHRRRDFDVGDVSYHRKMTVRVRDNCRWSWSISPPSPFRNFVENPQFFFNVLFKIHNFAHSFHRLFCVTASPISHFALY